MAGRKIKKGRRKRATTGRGGPGRRPGGSVEKGNKSWVIHVPRRRRRRRRRFFS